MCATLRFLMYCKQHAQCNIAPRWRGLMHIKNVDNHKYFFVPTFFVLKFNTNLFLLKWRNIFWVGTKEKVGSGHRNKTFFILFALHRLKYQNIFISNRK